MPNFVTASIALALGLSLLSAQAEVVIDEIMYHPASENSAEEFIELYNSGAAPVAVGGWKFTSGVDFTFPAGTVIPAGGHLVVAANQAAFSAKYPTVTAFVAGWSGQLSNSSNRITLEDSLGTTIDEVDYADDGDWGERRRQDPPDYGHRGWHWVSDADGGGKSLELINPLFDNTLGQNWAASSVAGGTPGTANSRAASDIAPVILDGEHFPLIPTSTQKVTVTCRVIDDQASPLTVQAHYRDDGAPAFTTVPMFDDGAHGDALAGDGVFGVELPERPTGTLVEFYFTAKDNAQLTRTWPAPARDYTGDLVQTCNLLYEVDDTAYSGAMPIYRLVMRAVDRTELDNINTNSGNPPFPFNPGEAQDQTESHARFNATFISQDGTGRKLRYLTGVRNRGNGSRSLQPMNFAVQFPNADTWNGYTDLNLNSQYTPWQLFGSAIYRKAGLASPESRPIQIRVNGANPATGTGAPAYGFYVCNEYQNSDFAEHHFPQDSGGNIYRGQRFVTSPTAEGTDIYGANLAQIIPSPTETLSLVDLYKLNYRKQTNEAEDDWTDLFALTAALAKGHNGATVGAAVTYDADYVASVEAKVDVPQWMRWFAVNAFADNEETNLSNGDGDDYSFYIGQTDPRAKLIPYDLDTTFGRSGGNVPTHGIFRMNDAPNGTPTVLNPLMKHPKFAPIYYAELKRLLDGPFNPAEFNPFVDEIIGGIAPASVLNTIKTFNTARHTFITGLVPLATRVTSSQTSAGVALPITNGLPTSTAATCNLIGVANAIQTRSVKVAGVQVSWSPWNTRWTATDVALTPGVNRILIQSFDENGVEIDRVYHDVWYNTGTQTVRSGTLAASETWTPAGGPYRVDASFTVPSGLTLTIQPGSVVMLGNSTATVNFTVANGGRLLAEGTETQPIRFIRAPGATYTWGGIIINGGAGSPECRIAHAYIEGNSSVAIDVNAGSVVLDHLQFGTTTQEYVSLDGASFLVSNCIFPTATAAFELVHGTQGIKAGGRGIIRDCFLGRANGYSDVIDFTGGNRPGPIIQIINNVFTGTDDDLLDLDGTDAWVEGNIFMHVHRNGSPDSASAISGGDDSGDISHITAVGNLFYDVDQMATAKIGNFYTLLNNTVIDQNGRGSDDAVTAVVNLADVGTTAGAGMYLEGNIIHSAVELARNYVPASSIVTFNNNILPMPWTGPGAGNRVIDPLLNDPFDIPTPTELDFRTVVPLVREKFGLQSCSPGVGTGPNGADMGGVRLTGVSIGGAPVGKTSLTSATLVIGTLMTGNGIPSTANAFPSGSGWTVYKWRVNGGAWSAETPLSQPITLSNLANGSYIVDVTGRNDAGFYQDNPEFGQSARVSSVTWTVDTTVVDPPPTPRVRINEVLAFNTETQNFGSAFPDIIELYNAGTTEADISGWGLTDNGTTPYKYAFPSSTKIAAGGYLVVYASASGSVPLPRTGFGLKAGGDTLTLTRSVAAGGGIADVVPFGNQLPDYSISRCNDGSWELGRPTFGSANILSSTAPLTAVRINEWLADAAVLAPQDFVELMNTATLPVNVGDCYLTDNPSDWPDRNKIRQLTFIQPGGYLAFKADSDPEQGPDHLNFKLDPLQGDIGLFSPTLGLIDNVVYGPQSTDISQGRSPNGTGTIAFFSQPTPGGPNPTAIGNEVTSTVNLLPANAGWKYFASATSAPADDAGGLPYYAAAFNDSTWTPTAPQLFYIENATLTNTEGFAKTTVLPGITTTRPYQTYYFRTHFNFAGSVSGATLTAKIMLDDGAVIYLNGVEVARVRMPSGTPTYSTLATTSVGDAAVETITIPAANLLPGDNVIAVAVHQVSNQTGTNTSSDVVWGMKLDASYTVSTGNIPVVLNEVLAINTALPNPDTTLTGWIEMHNTSNTAVDISGMSLSNDPAQPRKYVFPAGTTLPADGYIVLKTDSLTAPSATNAGFDLGGSGGFVGLYHTLADGGGLHDSVAYGRQVANSSVGRTPNGTGPWNLCVATRGAINAAAALGAITDVRINEWLASPLAGSSDFLELYNTGAAPVALGGLYLTDDLTDRTKSLIPPLSFLGSSGNARWQRWIADGDNKNTPEHVNFELSELGDAIGLYTSAGFPLNTVSFGSQAIGTSGGRFPDGSSSIAILMPTPAAANQLPSTSDTDGDGLPDSWEIANGLNPGDPSDADADKDKDGSTNRQEYLAGTDPSNNIDRLTMNIISVNGAGQAVLTFRATVNHGYTVQYRNATEGGDWARLVDIPPQSVTQTVTVTDTSSAGKPTRFYRVVTPAVP
jgi:hypothetical protein